ncbi:alpha-galactosidase [Pedobacter sp. L105]|uniref:alpha-galactosidase n=1 Tax=Pedobacter sp. L105 TaxID=1641871 RepID=UPI0020B1624B|nr:alpha-galactosidase [Pedobacter sp. L105]
MNPESNIIAKSRWLNQAKFLFLFVLSSAAMLASAQEAHKVITIETRHNAMALQVGANKRVSMIYFGHKLAHSDEYANIPSLRRQGTDPSGIANSAYTPAGSRNLLEPAIEVTHANGNTSLDLQYVSDQTQNEANNVSTTSIVLKDPVYAFTVTLYYRVYADDDVVEQWSVIKQTEKGNVTLHKFASANLYLTANSYWLNQFHGDWAREMQPQESELTAGIKTLDSKLGTRTDLFQPPSFMVSFDKPATEDEGKVLLGSLEWSGNFKIDLEVDPTKNLRLIAGMNPYASEYSLKPGEEFKTPAFLYTYSEEGKGNASRNLQRWARDFQIVDGKGARLTILNNWESTFFDFNETKLAALLKDTKKLGTDVFLLDDGWFGNKYPRNSDNAGLGDWKENKAKLPSGIGYLVKEAQNNDVKFGIWIEPEMVNPKSELNEKHPDWVIKQPNREDYLYRNQNVLDLSNPKVQDFVFGILDNLFTKNPQLGFIKWDCNAVIYNAYSAYEKKQSHLYIDYVRGLYSVLARVRAKYPKVPMMLCSGGGGRVDYGALKYFTEFWPSDNTDPLERVFIQYEYSYFYPAITSDNHVTDWGKQPIKFRTDVAMMGKLGFDIMVSKLNADELQFCQQAIQTYKGFSDVVWHGDQYRLLSPWQNDLASVLYLSEDHSKSIMFNYLVSNRYDAGSHLPIPLKGLNPDKRYTVKEVNLYPGTKSAINETLIFTGDFLMKVGINPVVNAHRASVILEIDEVK